MSTGKVTVRDDLSKPVVGFRRILVATGFSDGAQGALEYALTIARRFKSKVYLAHVIPSQVFHFVPPESSAEAIQKAKVFASGALRRWIDSAAMGGRGTRGAAGRGAGVAGAAGTDRVARN